MIPEPEDMLDVVRDWEEMLAKDGWDDTPPLLALIIENDDQTGYWAYPTPIQPTMLHDDPFAGLTLITKAFESGGTQSALSTMPPESSAALTGILFSNLGWYATAQQLDQYPNRSLADVPGARRVRQAYAIDCGGRAYVCIRLRGEEPEIYQCDNDQDLGAGRVPELLVRLLKSMSRHAPAGAVDRPALNKLLRLMKEESAKPFAAGVE